MKQNKNSIIEIILKYLREIAVIVIGVSISFFVDKYKSDNQDKESAKLLTQNLILDLEKDSAQLSIMLIYAEIASQKVDSLYNNLSNPSLKKDSLVIWIKALSYSSAFVPTNLTYEEIKQNGLSKLIKETKTKRAIYDLYTNYYEDLKIMNTKVSSFIDLELSPFLNTNMPFTIDNIYSKKQIQDILILMENNKFRNLIKNARKDKEYNVLYYDETFKKVQELLKLLRKK